MNTKINSFNGGYSYLSNFYDAPVLIDGIRYLNSEAAYQAGKVEPDRRGMFSNLSAYQAKKLGKSVQIRKGWDDKRADHMRKVVHEKFMQNPTLARALICTGDTELEEGNSWHDNFFGNCYCPKCLDTPGQNMLGKILMDERQVLKDIVDDYIARERSKANG